MEANNIGKMSNLKIVQIIPGTIFFTEFASFTPESNEEEKWLPDMGVPNPSSIEWEGAVSTNMEKNARGDVFLEYVSKKRKVTMNWDFLTQAQYRNLLNHLEVDFNNSEQAVLYYKIKALNYVIDIPIDMLLLLYQTQEVLEVLNSYNDYIEIQVIDCKASRASASHPYLDLNVTIKFYYTTLSGSGGRGNAFRAEWWGRKLEETPETSGY